MIKSFASKISKNKWYKLNSFDSIREITNTEAALWKKILIQAFSEEVSNSILENSTKENWPNELKTDLNIVKKLQSKLSK